MSRTEHDNLVELLQQPGARPIFVTGAGISIASGIPPFRGTPDAVWERDVLDKGTIRFFHRKPVKSWSWFLKVFEKARNAEPNPGHEALVGIEQMFGERFLLVTQNVDGLHTKAGSKNCIEVHGTVRHLRCTKSVCLYGPPTGTVPWDEVQIARFQANPHQNTLPRCPGCGALLRMHILWFDESYDGHQSYGLDTVFNALDTMTVLVFIGTSFAVTITDIMMRAGYERAVPMFVIDPNATAKVPEMHYIQEPSETYLPKLAAALK